jgi:hypothetical protein
LHEQPSQGLQMPLAELRDRSEVGRIPVCAENSDSAILVMKAAQNRS